MKQILRTTLNTHKQRSLEDKKLIQRVFQSQAYMRRFLVLLNLLK
jgi:hypothetical protein